MVVFRSLALALTLIGFYLHIQSNRKKRKKNSSCTYKSYHTVLIWSLIREHKYKTGLSLHSSLYLLFWWQQIRKLKTKDWYHFQHKFWNLHSNNAHFFDSHFRLDPSSGVQPSPRCARVIWGILALIRLYPCSIPSISLISFTHIQTYLSFSASCIHHHPLIKNLS